MFVVSCGSDYARGLVGFIEVNGPRKGGSFIHPVPLLSVRTLENFGHSFPHRDVCMPSGNSSTPISMLSKPFEEQPSYVHNFDTRAVLRLWQSILRYTSRGRCVHRKNPLRLTRTSRTYVGVKRDVVLVDVAIKTSPAPS